jgi:iron complex outermembrane recepter protein
VPLGTQRSQGVEIEFQGEIVRGWDVFGSFAWLDAEFTAGQFEGLQPVNAPRFGASLFTSYEFQNGLLRGLGIGGGVVHKRGRETFDEDGFGIFGATQVFDFGDFTELDMRVFYDLDRWRLQLSGTNLTDEKYYSPTFNNFLYALHVNPARAVTASVAYKF